MYYDVIMTGFGGQGIQTISLLMAIASINKGLEVSYLPSYGVEKRGGRTDVTVIVSDIEIGSPITNTPKSLIALDEIGLEFYQKQLTKDSLLVVNTSLINESRIAFTEGKIVKIDFNDEAVALGNPKMANMVTLGSFIERIPFLDIKDVEAIIEEVIPERLHDTIPDNLKAMKRGIELSKEQNNG